MLVKDSVGGGLDFLVKGANEEHQNVGYPLSGMDWATSIALSCVENITKQG